MILLVSLFSPNGAKKVLQSKTFSNKTRIFKILPQEQLLTISKADFKVQKTHAIHLTWIKYNISTLKTRPHHKVTAWNI